MSKFTIFWHGREQKCPADPDRIDFTPYKHGNGSHKLELKLESEAGTKIDRIATETKIETGNITGTEIDTQKL